MRHWMVIGLLAAAAAACDGERNPNNQQGDNDGGDNDVDFPKTCEGLYDYVDGCFSDAGCPGAFVRDNLIEQCDDAGLTSSDIDDRYEEGCTESIRFFCTIAVIEENDELFGLPCCQEVYSCASDQVCEPLDGAGVCITANSAFPAGAENCTDPDDCKLGYKCVEGESSTKCVQICVPE